MTVELLNIDCMEYMRTLPDKLRKNTQTNQRRASTREAKSGDEKVTSPGPTS